jgi:hypothetical protein
MSSRSPRELLEELRAYLLHFEESGHIGDDADVAEIKRRLCARIEEVESALRRTSVTLSDAETKIDPAFRGCPIQSETPPIQDLPYKRAG